MKTNIQITKLIGSVNLKARITAAASVLVVAGFPFPSQALDNLIVNGDFEAGNVGFTTAFTYSPGNITSPQAYDILGNPRTSHGLSASYGDRTTGLGQMMALNGTTLATDQVAWTQTVSVLSNSNYTFDLWTSTWYSAGEMRVAINGITLGSAFTSPGAPGVWQQTERTWASGTSTMATIEIFNTTSSFEGNDFALDDIAFRPVPEPTSLTLLLGGSLLLLRRRPAASRFLLKGSKTTF